MSVVTQDPVGSARSQLMDEFLQQIAQSSPYAPREKVTLKDETGRKVPAAEPELPPSVHKVTDHRQRKVRIRK